MKSVVYSYCLKKKSKLVHSTICCLKIFTRILKFNDLALKANDRMWGSLFMYDKSGKIERWCREKK